MVLAFIFLSFTKKLGRLLPPLFGALIVGASFWGLALGFLIACLLERKDFRG